MLLIVDCCLSSSACSTWKWRGYNIRYQYAGTSGPALVLIHGFGANRCAAYTDNPCLSVSVPYLSLNLQATAFLNSKCSLAVGTLFVGGLLKYAEMHLKRKRYAEMYNGPGKVAH